jgi:outer membrane protein assembly factor BamB
MKIPARWSIGLVLSATLYIGAAAVAADWPGFRGPHGTGISDEKELALSNGELNVLWKTKLPGPGASGPISVGNKVLLTCYTGYGTKLGAGIGKGAFGKGAFGKSGFGMGGFGKGGFGKPDPAELKEQEKLRLVVLCIDAENGDLIWQRDVSPKLPEVVFGGMIREHGYATSTPVTDGKRVYAFFGKSGVVALDLDGEELWHVSVGTGTNFFGMASSPVAYKDLVIVNANIECGALVALDKHSGKEVWRTKVSGHTWGSPLLVDTADGQELVVSMPDKVTGVDPADGKELWRCKGIKTGGGFGGGPGGGYGGTYSTPTAHEGVVYVCGGGGPAGPATALAVRTGGRGDVEQSHVLWRKQAGTSYSSPVVIGQYVYFVDGMVTCLQADTGNQVYKERLYSSRGEYVSPVAVDDKLIVLTRFDGLFVVAAGSKFARLASHDFAGDKSTFNAGPAVMNSRIFARSNQYLYCLGEK